MPTIKFSNFPVATVAFGSNFRQPDYEKFQKNIGILKYFAVGGSQALQMSSKYAQILAKATPIASTFEAVLTVLVEIVGEVDKLYNELKILEHKIFSTILEGKLMALERNLTNIQDGKTSESQKISEIVTAISHFDELLPVFSSKESIFRERYYQGAPLFVQFCTLLRGICLIAEQGTGYNTTHLQTLKRGYQEMLDWYQITCTGRRMASCYVRGMLRAPGGEWTYDWDRHYKKYKGYYGGDTLFPWKKYAEDLGGEGRRLWCGSARYCNIHDAWDTRPLKEVQFERFEIHHTNARHVPFKEVQYHMDVLAEYRSRVETVMLKFFKDAALA